MSLASAARRSRFRRRLRIPPELTGANLTIPIVSKRVRILPGRKTRMWTYGGTFPGPTIRRPAGEGTQVTFVHRLPVKAGELSVHLHGGHQESEHDGQPGGLTALQRTSLYCDISPGLSARGAGNDLLIAPGDSRTYVYPGVEDGAAERGAFHWYHDHRLDNTSRNVWRGLAGMWITDEPTVEDPLNLPTGSRDIPLMITDRSLNRRNRLKNPFRNPGRPPFDHVTGRHILVNGVVTPFARVPAARHRLRLLNTSSFRSYNLKLEGLAMVQIATESGLMPRALRRRRILLGPGERAEVVVDFAKARGDRVVLKSVPRRDADGGKLGSKPFVGEVMEFRVGREAVPDPTTPFGELEALNPLRPLPAWVADADPEPSHTWRIEIGTGLRPSWLINGRTFDPGFVEEAAKPRIGEVVTWRLKNATAVGHLLHLHHTDWYMLKRNGQTPPAHERCLKETFFLDPGDEVIVAGKISDYTGKYVVHCHMLDHEDHGLMSQFEVQPAAE
jgi:FtsP/CotA-like multicopper oxidase with cupredoxin domain